MTAPFLQGFSVGIGLILAIGAQNAFVLRQGLKREHTAVAVTVCALSDITLITLGGAGLGALVAGTPLLRVGAVWAGSAFLIVYGALAMRTAVRRQGGDLAAEAGTIAGSQDSVGARSAFTAGAATASVVFFPLLGFGAARLAPLFAHPITWKLLDASVALVMWAVAASLLGPRLLG
jgi:L-lysine exporter family protein LysE/ArgO